MATANSSATYEELAPDPESREGKALLRKAIGASAIGNATEWYDYGVYGVSTTYLTHAFFPGSWGTVLTMLGFAISFALRPLGGMIWGPIGDRIGRKSVLAITIVLISGATALIGVLPTHAVAGIWAPILLILLRVIQGFSTGGEYGGAATFMAEYSPDKKRGHYGSFLEFGTLAGFSLGTALVLILDLALTDEQMQTWGWRIPFLMALPMGLIGLYLRSQVEDTPVFQEIEKQAVVKGSAWSRFVDLLSNYWRPILIMFGMVIALNVANYTLLSYQPTYLKNTINLSEDAGNIVVLIGQLVMMLLIPFFGSMSDRTGRKPMWWFSLIGLFVFALPLYWLMGQGFAWAIVGFVILGVLYIPQLSTISATFPAMFPTQVRYAGFAISYNVATAAFGGTAPLVNDWVIKVSNWNLFPAAYMMGACAIGMVALVFLKETAGASLRGTGIPEKTDDIAVSDGAAVSKG
ncbi:MFS transporter [Gordonia aichiensis]|uniref:Putative proline/betaine transporter n=1 Tax=Gordonia aichiensis NBRC 108223 TaxID=1220583 RepID=L7KD34_9ACTN|nr:MFS transporter [Gordonia aichiensis]GAC46790.1 proline/betaine transporter [Gordonia aichiensis NBRC 108223]